MGCTLWQQNEASVPTTVIDPMTKSIDEQLTLLVIAHV